MLSDTQLLYLNSVGLIPGPEENEEEFLRRTEECLHLSQTIATNAQGVEGFKPEELAPPQILKQPLYLTQELYDTQPDWIPVFFSNQGLAPWHGGCAWICRLRDDAPTIAFFQLRKLFASRLRYLGIYHRDELVAHELSHIGRMTFQEPLFEEILAFRTATSRLRRWFGPILLSPKETLAFFVILVLLLLMDLTSVLQPSPQGLQLSLWLKLIPLALIAFGVIRLARRQRLFAKCRRNLGELFHSNQVADSVIYRLTDKEIALFAGMSQKEIVHYVQETGKTSLRWRLLLVAYFSKIAPRPFC